tara:strand:- start:473 stop:1012 length:540 start_codon:yes stop_codon:yes gene_type:complete
MTRLTQRLLLLLCLSLVSKPVKAETDVIAQPNAIGNSSIINQNMNINNGMTGKQQFGTLVCSQPTMAFTPFYTGNEAENPDPENGSYSINQGWGFQISWMIPLGSTNHTCAELALVKLELAKVELEKNILDTNVVRILKCAELAKAGYMINPSSDYAWICEDVVNIRNWVRQNPDLFSD